MSRARPGEHSTSIEADPPAAGSTPDAAGAVAAGPAPPAPTPPAPAARRTRRLDPDRVAALEEERDHLARSLRELDVELAAGDIGPDDHATLRDDYVVRTAAVLRALDEQRELRDRARRPVSARRRLLVGAAVVAFAAGAGLLVARVAGTRTSQSGLTGEIRAGTSQELARCLELFALVNQGGDGNTFAEAVRCYTGVIEQSPDSAEALSYRGWLLVRAGDTRLDAQAADDLDRAVRADPTYPDARAFRAVVFARQGRFDAAQAELDVLDSLPNVAPIIDQILDQYGVREQVTAGLAASTTTSATPAG